MLCVVKFVALASLLVLIQCSPYDDGKWRPGKYKAQEVNYDDGKYYRPLTEGKYMRGDEGKYLHVLYPYIHLVGPNGGFGGNGGYGGNGPDGPDGDGGPGGPGGPGGLENNYIGYKIYAEKYPYITNVINELVEKYVSMASIGDDELIPGDSNNRKIYADKETTVKCHYLMQNDTKPEFTTQYPPNVNIRDNENFGSYYSFRGTKLLSSSITSKLKLEYEVFVRVVEVENEDNNKD